MLKEEELSELEDSVGELPVIHAEIVGEEHAFLPNLRSRVSVFGRPKRHIVSLRCLFVDIWCVHFNLTNYCT